MLWGATAELTATYFILSRRASIKELPLCAPLHGRQPQQNITDHAEPLVSIVVPARDEARNIERCVASLLAQEYTHFEVIVVDDDSHDSTPSLLEKLQARHPRGNLLKVIRVDKLPQGWTGKSHALHVGVTAAHGEWLLFTDADTEHHPSALSGAMQCAERHSADLLSLVTGQDLPDFWGKALMPLAVICIGAMFPARLVNDPATTVAMANGQFLLVRREAYDCVGGFSSRSLRTSVTEDKGLAVMMKHSGHRVVIADGRSVVRTRMYQGLREYWLGFGKNAYIGTRGGPAFYVIGTFGVLWISLAPFAVLLTGLIRRRKEWVAAGSVQATAMFVCRARVNKMLGLPLRHMWSHPFGGTVLFGILVHSGWDALTRRQVEWKGRAYDRQAVPTSFV
jgi:chlorobactene glucosyltransferase